MRFEIVSLFPEYFELSLRQSVIGKALDKKLFEIEIINLRDFAVDRHHTVDDTPYGGGGGMVLMLEPLDRCLQSLGYSYRSESDAQPGELLLTSAAGKPFGQKQAKLWSMQDRMTIICGHYLGVDERLLQLYDVTEVSIGDFVLTGGEPAAAVLVDAVARLVPGVLGNFESAIEDSHMEDGSLGTPVYTKPADYRGLTVPEELTGGNHKEIERFRRKTAIKKCYESRPELLSQRELTEEEQGWIDQIKSEEED